MSRWSQIVLTVIAIAALGLLAFMSYQLGEMRCSLSDMKSDLSSMESDISWLRSGAESLQSQLSAFLAKELEGATAELHEAQTAIAACMGNAGITEFNADVTGWDGSPGIVKAGGDDAANYLGGKTFKATYDVAKSGDIIHGTNVSWIGIVWGTTGWRLG